jgi:hypothetical protein
LHSPGDLDWWCPAGVVGEFSTARQDRSDRFGLLPLLSASDADWIQGTPPDFPQPEYYAASLAIRTPSAVMNVVELVLPCDLPLESLTLTVLGMDPAIGLLSVVAEAPVTQTSPPSSWLPSVPADTPQGSP